MIDVRDYGAFGDGIADDTVAIQAAIDAAVFVVSAVKPKVVMPAGLYKITDTLQLGYGDDQRSVHLEGEGQKLRCEGNYCGTGILPTFNDRPALAVNGARRTTIRGLSIKGLNAAWIDAAQLGRTTPTVDDLNQANWVDPSFPAPASSQYAPYCAIAIDPFCGTAPAVSYPFSYGKTAHSSAVLIEDVEISGFVVGMMNNPSPQDGNGDFTKILNCRIEKCQYAVSIGNAQSRLVHLTDCDIATVYCGIATTKHGLQNGKPSISVQSSQFANIIKWLDVPNTSYGGGPSFRDCYGESIYTLGNVGLVPASTHFPTLFDGCDLHFAQWANRDEPLYWLDASGEGQVTFRGCSFSRAPVRPTIWAFGGNPAAFRFENTFFDAGGNATTAAQKRAFNGCNGVVVGKYGEQKFGHASIRTSACFDPVTLAKTGPNQFNDDFAVKTYGTSIHAKRIAPTLFDLGALINVPKYLINKLHAVISGGRTLTVDLTAAGQTAQKLIDNGGEVGDVMVDQETGVVFIVEARAGLVLTLAAQNGYKQDGTLITPITNASYFWASNCRL